MRRESWYIIGFLGLILIVFILSLNHIQRTPTIGLGSTSSTPSEETPTSTTPCDNCLSILDNNKTINLSLTSRITIQLPDTYNKNALIISPAGYLGETFGASPAPGFWVRTFEATQVGTTTITVPEASSTGLFILHVNVLDASNTWQNGMTTITPANKNQIIYFSKSERFLIQLGTTLKWTLSFSPTGIITRVPNTLTTDGYQGVYEATRTGTATMTATGRPICASTQACPQYVAVEKVMFVVR